MSPTNLMVVCHSQSRLCFHMIKSDTHGTLYSVHFSMNMWIVWRWSVVLYPFRKPACCSGWYELILDVSLFVMFFGKNLYLCGSELLGLVLYWIFITFLQKILCTVSLKHKRWDKSNHQSWNNSQVSIQINEKTKYQNNFLKNYSNSLSLFALPWHHFFNRTFHTSFLYIKPPW